MSSSNVKSVKETVFGQAASFGLGAAAGAATGKTIEPHRMLGDPRNPNLAAQVGSAVGSSLAAGSGLNGAVVAGSALVAAKVATGIAVATAAAPAVAAVAVIGGGIYALKKLFS